MDATQLYETVIVNRDPDAPPAEVQALRIVTIPARSLTHREVPPIEQLAEQLGFERSLQLGGIGETRSASS